MKLAYRFFSTHLNALLERDRWAREALAPHVGGTACLSIPPMTFLLTVQDGGYVAMASVDEQITDPTVSITVPTNACAAFMQGGAQAVMKQARIEGDAEFAATLAKLAQHLRPDLEEVLARFLGDVPAHGVGQGARRLRRYAYNTAHALFQSSADYVLEEKPRWLSASAFAHFEAEVVQLRDVAERLEKRMARLEAIGTHR